MVLYELAPMPYLAPLSLYIASEKQETITRNSEEIMFNDLDRTQIAAALLVGIASVAIQAGFYGLGMLRILHGAV